jgi:ABC-2 type transport system ATP-binding protein
MDPSSAGDPIIRTARLRREFGATVAVNDLDLAIEPGAVLALVGPNGAGKTTLLKMICGLLPPTSGSAWVNGVNVLSHPRRVQQELGFLPDFFGLYDGLTVWEYLDYFARAYRLPSGDRDHRIDTVLAQVQLSGHLTDDIHALSRGMRQRLGIARTLIHQPSILLLDEPASGLDPEARHDLQTLFTSLSRQGKTLVVSSHILAELEDYCTHVAILQVGRLVAAGRIEDVRRGLGIQRTIRMSVLDGWPNAEGLLRRDPAVSGVASDGASHVFQFSGDDAALARLLGVLVGAGVAVTAFGEERRTIEDTYLALTRRKPLP